MHPPSHDSTFTLAERLDLLIVAVIIGGLAVTAARVPGAIVLMGWFSLLGGLTVLLPSMAARLPLAGGLRWIVPGVVLLSVYESLGRVIVAVGPPARDAWVLAVERQLTRGRLPPLRALSLSPLVSDLLSLAYLLYFLVPVALIWMLIRQRQARDADHAMVTLLVAFYTHYVIYVAVPVVGPLRTPGIPATVRTQLTGGGRITAGTRTLIGVLEGTPQDAFPSAHTSVAVLAAALARHHRLRWWRWFRAATIAIVVSTVLLGYHYVVDVLAALPIVAFAWYGGEWLVRRDRLAAIRVPPPAPVSDSPTQAMPPGPTR